MANLQCLPASNILPYQADVDGSGDNIIAPNSMRIAFGTISGGPYVNFSAPEVGNNTVGQTFSRTLTDLASETTYYYVVQEIDGGGNVVDTSASECSFQTTGYNPQCELLSVDLGGNPPTAQVRVTADNVPPNLFLSIKFSNTPGGPYTQLVASEPGENIVGQTIETEWILEGCQTYFFVAEISEEDGFLYGPSLLSNGDFEASVGPAAGPGWTSSYFNCPSCGLYTSPCSAQFFQYQGAGQCPGPWFGVPPNGPSAPGGTSFNVNVGPNVNAPMIEWANIPLTNGKNYKLTVDAAIINPPFAVRLAADGGATTLSPVTAPAGFRVWDTTETVVTWTGLTGGTSVGLFSDSPVFAGNDHMFDNIVLREQEDPAQSSECSIPVITEVDCLGVSDVTCTSANFHGMACGIFGGTFTQFEYWECPADPNDNAGHHTTPLLFHNGSTSQELFEAVVVLEPNTTYCFRVVAYDESIGDYLAVSDNVNADCDLNNLCCFTTPDCETWCGGFWDPENCEFVDPGNGEPYMNCWPAPVRDGFPGEADVPAPPLDLPPPQADLICTDVTNLTDVSATINGTADPSDVTHFYRLVQGTSPGNYTFIGTSVPGNGGLVSLTENLAGLTAETPYWYAVQELDTDGITVLETSAECSFATLRED